MKWFFKWLTGMVDHFPTNPLYVFISLISLLLFHLEALHLAFLFVGCLVGWFIMEIEARSFAVSYTPINFYFLFWDRLLLSCKSLRTWSCGFSASVSQSAGFIGMYYHAQPLGNSHNAELMMMNSLSFVWKSLYLSIIYEG